MSELDNDTRGKKRPYVDNASEDKQPTQRQRPTASARARKKEYVSDKCKIVHDPLFAPEYRELNQDDEHFLDSFEKELCSRKEKGSMSELNYNKDDDDDDEYDDDSDREDEDDDEEEEEEEEEGDGGGKETPLEKSISTRSRRGTFSVRGRFGSEKCKDVPRIEEFTELQESIDGGPTNPELLKSFRGHVAYYIWHGRDRNVLKGHKQTERLSKWKPKRPEVQKLIMRSQLSHLADCMYSNLNMPLISTFIERWHPETNSFHLPFGEMTTTLHDVAYILNIPVVGEAIFGKSKLNDLKGYLSEMLNLSIEDINKEYHSGTIKLNTISNCCSSKTVDSESMARGYLLWMLGSTLFVDRSATSVSPYYLPYLLDLEKVKNYAWGAATLAYMYRQLGVASRFDNAQIGGCLTLLQAWIYEYFPAFRPQKNQKWDSTMPHSLKWITHPSRRIDNDVLISYRRMLDEMKVEQVTWIPFDRNPHLNYPVTLYSGIIHCRTITEPYMPDRVMRQFGYVQIIPMRLFTPKSYYRGPENNKYKCNHDENLRSWESWEHHCLRVGHIGTYRANFATEVVDGYHQYYISRSHTRLIRDDVAKAADIPPSQMPETARLQYVGARLYPLHPDVRHQTDSVTFWQCLDEVAKHMEDWMPKLQEERQRRHLRGT